MIFSKDEKFEKDSYAARQEYSIFFFIQQTHVENWDYWVIYENHFCGGEEFQEILVSVLRLVLNLLFQFIISFFINIFEFV